MSVAVTGVDITFCMQHGLVRDQITINSSRLTLKTLKDEACNFVNTKFADHGLTKLNERLLLFRHVYDTPNILQMINSAAEVEQDSLVEIVVSGLVSPNDEEVIRPHFLSVHSYKTPTFCDFCGELLFGLVRQGLKCDGCWLNFHKRCAYKIPNNCSYARQRRSSFNVPPPPGTLSPKVEGNTNKSPDGSTVSLLASTASLDTNDSSSLMTQSTSSPSLPKSPRGSVVSSAGRPIWVERELAGRIKVPHTFSLHTYTKPTVCHYCKKLLKGLFKQGFQCKDCRYNAHRKCMERLPPNCLGEAPDSTGLPMGSDDDDGGEGTTSGYHYDSGDNDEDCPPSPAPPRTTAEREPGDEANEGPPSPANNIPLMRIAQSVKHTKRISKVVKEGWMVHFTNKNPERKRHYWRLDTKTITLYQNDSTATYYKEIHLSEILNIETPKVPHPDDAENGVIHCFELRTTNLDFYVGQETFPRQREGGVAEVNPPESGLGAYLARGWEQEIRLALTPVKATSSQPAASSATTPGVAAPPAAAAAAAAPPTSRAPVCSVVVTSPAGAQVSPSEPAPPKPGANHYMQRMAELDPLEVSCQDISQLYQVYSDEVLGSGQFGIVYAAVHRKSGREVAVKVVDKLRFPTKQKIALKNELSILQAIRHQCVVSVERMFETPDRVFVVMEKLQGDMLELILSSEKGRLSERVTKYLIFQILAALRYLHSKNIVHCDLKPENVLLSDHSDFPQVKLCDFGFARIIGEKSFRKSVVGTPAYLAPEVLRNKGYNRSLDMWSVGVVMYVSLSGTFPFNEDEDINDQITNAAFMYPPNPWKEITPEAIDLISNLLQVNKRKRLTVEKSFNHAWMMDYQLYCDARLLECRVGVGDENRFLVHVADDAGYESLRKPNQPKLASLIQAQQASLSAAQQNGSRNSNNNNSENGAAAQS